MRIATGFAIAAMFVTTQAAQAAAPKFQGVYTLSMSTICQLRLTMTKNSGNVTDLNQTLFDNRLEEDLATATFNPTTKKVTIKGFGVFGTALLISGKPGNLLKEEVINFVNVPYSNTATTINLFGDESRIIYGHVKQGIVKQAVFQRHDKNCAQKGTLFQP
jgi:hypothetical protein